MKRSVLLARALVALLVLVGCGDGGSSGAPPDAGLTDAGLTDAAAPPPDLDPFAAGLAACDASSLAEADLIADLRRGLLALAAGRRATWNALFRLNADGSASAGSIGPLTWDPSHDSATFDSTDFERNTPLLISNKVASGSTRHLALAMAGDTGTARYAAFGANLLNTIAAAKVPDPQLQALAESTLSWLLRNDRLKTTAFKVVEAHLPNQYFFPHEPATRKWITDTYPLATLNAGFCESALLEGCLTGANLLIISMDTGPDNNHKVPYDGDAVMRAVRAAQARGVPVLYLHYYRDPNDLGQRLMDHFRLAATSNYWSIEQLAGFSPAADYPTSGGLGPLRALVDTLGDQSLAVSDYASCLGSADRVWDCAAQPLQDKLLTGANAVRAALTALDRQAVPLCAAADRRLLREFMLLGDKYRTGDARTPALKYPVDPWKDPTGLLRAVFSDWVVFYSRGSNPAQKDLGSYTCPWKARVAGTCTGLGYDPARVPLTTVKASAPVPAYTTWTATGAYALPGAPFTLTRTDGLGAGVEVRALLGFQRSGSTHSMKLGAYTRPQYLQSTAVLLAPNQPVVLSTPYGGPIYLQIAGNPQGAPAPVSVTLERVGRHPAILDVGDAAQVAAFPDDVRTSPLPHVDIRAAGFEIHLRKDKVLDTVTTGYAGNTAAFLEDIRQSYINQVYGLAGFKLPGVALTASLSADVQAVCTHLGWSCTDEALHSRKTTQHANFDEYASCGSGCSGNPFDADWSIDPIGWGESHELGHNLQVSLLNIGYTDAAHASDWSSYQSRAGENSNNIFPYHTLWRYRRVVKGDVGALSDGHMNHKDVFAAVQSDLAGLTRTIGGASRRVIFDSACNRLGDYAPGTPNNRYEAMWQDAGYAANNGLRMSFYLQLPLMAHGQALRDGTSLKNGFDLFVLLYDAARLFQAAAVDATTWGARRAALGFGAFPYDGQATYAGSTVAAMTGNDFLLVALSYLTARDYRPYFDSRGVRYSALGAAQIDAHVGAGLVKGAVDTRMYALGAALPTLQLNAAPLVALDGTSKWPGDNWHPSLCP